MYILIEKGNIKARVGKDLGQNIETNIGIVQGDFLSAVFVIFYLAEAIKPIPGMSSQILFGLADDDVATFEDPIDEPDVEPDQSVDITSLETRDGLNAFQASVIGLLDKSTETLSVDTKGRVDDIKRSLVPVKNAIRDLVRAANPNEARRVQTPSDLSLAEILFFNDVGLENLEDVYERNQSIDDILLVPKGTVVEL